MELAVPISFLAHCMAFQCGLSPGGAVRDDSLHPQALTVVLLCLSISSYPFTTDMAPISSLGFESPSLRKLKKSKDPVVGIKKLRSEDLEYKCGHLGFGSGNNGTI